MCVHLFESGNRIWAEHVEKEDKLIQADEKEYEIARRYQQTWKTPSELLAEINKMRQCWEAMQDTDKGRKQIVSNFIERIVVYDEESDNPGR